MARIKFTALVESIQGTIAGTTFQRNAYGYTVKTKPNMLNPSTNRQRNSQQLLQRITSSWRNLSAANRDSWFAYAEAYPTPSRLNPDAYLSGYNLYVLVNTLRVESGLAILSAPSLSLQSVPLYEDNDVYLTGGVLTYSVNPTGGTGDWTILLYLTPPVPVGKSFVNFTPRFMAAYDFTVGSDNSISSRYLDLFGQLPVSGEFVGLRQVLICETTAQVTKIDTFLNEVQTI